MREGQDREAPSRGLKLLVLVFVGGYFQMDTIQPDHNQNDRVPEYQSPT